MNLFNLFGPPLPTIDAVSAKAKLTENPKLFLLDVREPEEYRVGHIQGANLIPLGELARRINDLLRDREIIWRLSVRQPKRERHTPTRLSRAESRQFERWHDWLDEGRTASKKGRRKVMFVQQFFVEGLGCASYLIGCESQGIAAVVDPERDVRSYLQVAEQRGLTITHIIETHLHADHVSGNTDLAQRTGAKVYMHASAAAEFPHEPLKDGDILELGNVYIQVRETPGHTPESITLLVSDTTRAPEPWMALTGDTLFVGDVGRPDLVGAEAARGLAGELYDSLFGRLLQLDDALMIYPGHGAGSLCGRAIGSVRSTTLGFERRHNPALAIDNKADFVDHMTRDLPEQPGNFRRIKAINRQGPKPLGPVEPHPLSLQQAIPYFRRGAALVDTRDKTDYVRGHVPGSVHLANDDQLSNRAGFVLPADTPIVLLVQEPAEYERAVHGLARVGFDQVIGYLSQGIKGWRGAGMPVVSGDIEDITPAQLHAILADGNRPVVVDVREPWEYAQGHVPGAVLIPLGQLALRISELDPTRPVAAICATGSRSQSASALLGQKGFVKVYNVLDGTDGWQSAGFDLDR